jgi:hypothetical protein
MKSLELNSDDLEGILEGMSLSEPEEEIEDC